MMILFFMRHAWFTRNFESTLRLLAERGHRVHLAFDLPEQPGKPGPIAELCARHQTITVGMAPVRTDVWRVLAGAIRACADYLRYLDPRYRHAHKLRQRALARSLRLLLRPAEAVLSRRPRAVGRLLRALRQLGEAIPSSRELERYIATFDPDVVLVTPLVDFNSPQAEYVKSARALGIRTGLCVASWDNLTNKGLIATAPDLVTVWNEVQAREAVDLHGISPDRVVVTGAQLFDEWFQRQPSTSREQFCRTVGLDPERPFLLYVCSSPFIAPHEVPFVRDWARAIRSAPDERLRRAGILVRPHPANAVQWDGADPGVDNAVVWPRGTPTVVDAAARAEFFDSLYHSAAAVGINTTALIEAGIVGRPVFTVLAPEFAGTQRGTLHFPYLEQVGGGLLRTAETIDEHLGQLADTLADGADGSERARSFVEAFVRPRGANVPATIVLADAIEHLARAGRTAPARPPVVGRALRLALFPLALLLSRGWWAARSLTAHAPSPAR